MVTHDTTELGLAFSIAAFGMPTRATARAIRVDMFGGPDMLRPVGIPQPVPGPGEALIQHSAIGVNFVDTQHRAGSPYAMSLPLIPGTEAAGVVAAVGLGVADVRVGERVAYAGIMPGVYAEYAAVPAERLVLVLHGFLQPWMVRQISAAAVVQAWLTWRADDVQ